MSPLSLFGGYDADSSDVGFIMYAQQPQEAGTNERFCSAPEHHHAAE